MIELKPCPFCGGENVGIYAFNIVVDARVECRDCGASSGEHNAEHVDGESHEEYEARCVELAVTAWNRRAEVGSDAQ
jgi:Lar family restriction alleviation protein